MAISSNPHWALDDIRALIAVHAPRVRCEMIDGGTRVRCRGATSDGIEVEAEVE